jgi:single-stranded DNA-binding protein
MKVAEALKKGAQVTVFGKLAITMREYQGKHYQNLDLTADDVMLPPKKDDIPF